MNVQENRNKTKPCSSNVDVKLWAKFDNYKSACKKFNKFKRRKQTYVREKLPDHYLQKNHKGKLDWKFNTIDKCEINAELNERELFGSTELKRLSITTVSVCLYNLCVGDVYFCLLVSFFVKESLQIQICLPQFYTKK